MDTRMNLYGNLLTVSVILNVTWQLVTMSSFLGHIHPSTSRSGGTATMDGNPRGGAGNPNPAEPPSQPVDAIAVDRTGRAQRALSPNRHGREPPEPPPNVSALDAITMGALDNQPLHLAPRNGLEKLFISAFKALRASTREGLSNADRRRLNSVIENISINDISGAIQEFTAHTAQASHAMPDTNVRRVHPPAIGPNPLDRLSPDAAKDFSFRTKHLSVGGSKHTDLSMYDLLQATTEVAEHYQLGIKPILSLLRRSLKEPARGFLESMVDSGASLAKVYSELLDFFSPKVSTAEAARKLSDLLSQPVVDDLDSFLGKIMSLSINSQATLPAPLATKAGHLLAVSHLNEFLGKHFPHIFTLVANEMAKLQSLNPSLDSSEILFAMMRLIKVHRAAIERPTGASHKVSEIGPHNSLNMAAGPMREPPRGISGSENSTRIDELTQQVSKLGSLMEKTINTFSAPGQLTAPNGAVESLEQTAPWAPNQQRFAATAYKRRSAGEGTRGGG